MNNYKWLILVAIFVIMVGIGYSVEPDYYVASGDTITLSTSCSDENDCNDDCGDDSDTLTITWSAGSGTFPGGNTGTSVSWQAPSISGNVTITAVCDDDGAVNDDASDSTSVTVGVVDTTVTLVVENNLTQCMEGRNLTFTATVGPSFPAGLTNPIKFTFYFKNASGTISTDVDWSTDRVEESPKTMGDVLSTDPDHKYTTPTYATAENDGFTGTSNTLNIDVYELWIDYLRDSSSGKAWKVVVNKNIAYGAIAASGAKNWDWDMEDGIPDQWSPTGGNGKTGTMTIPNSDMPSSNSKFGDSYGTVNVFCEDAEGGNNRFYSTSMNPSQKAKVFFEKMATTNPDGSVPNWYYYWKDGGVCGITSVVHYSNSGGFGFYTPGQSYINVCNLAPTVNTGPETYTASPGDSIIVTGQGSGIDCVAETIAHELYHKYFHETYNGQVDSDLDGIPDSVEATLDGITTLVNDPDTYNMGGADYSTYGDNEIRCRKKELNTGITVFPLKDWSESGKQW